MTHERGIVVVVNLDTRGEDIVVRLARGAKEEALRR
jgi:hypothetical protein